MNNNSNSVGIIGLGIIGSRIAKTLQQKDWQVSVWNRTSGKDPNALESPAEVARKSNALQTPSKKTALGPCPCVIECKSWDHMGAGLLSFVLQLTIQTGLIGIFPKNSF